MAKSGKILIERLRSEASYRRPSGPLWQPAVDVYRCPTGWKVKFDLAGVSPEDVQVLIADDKLIVRGVRRDSVMTEGWSYYQLEITYSRFERILQLPFDLSRAEIRVESNDGWFILHIDCGSSGS
ncbi:MAG TPA: Hsp20/alpha crystallin family protein [Blastocatellia bacterium]|nr:Hsp20/alpha crystallin family protein [Blastocatellia bacterium]